VCLVLRLRCGVRGSEVVTASSETVTVVGLIRPLVLNLG
jgi:hypothetical protein